MYFNDKHSLAVHITPCVCVWMVSVMTSQVRPSWGLFLRTMANCSFNDITLGFNSNDDRPSIIIEDASGIRMDNVVVGRGVGIEYDVLLRANCSAIVITHGSSTGGSGRKSKLIVRNASSS
jgi:hypothetical protein